MNQTLYLLSAVIVPLMTCAILLYYSAIGYQRTKLTAFKLWLVAGVLGLTGCILQAVVQFPTSPLSGSAHHGLWMLWAIEYIVSGIIGTWGSILLVRHVITISNASHAA